MNLFHQIGVDCEHSENFGKQCIRVLPDMCPEGGKFIQKQLELLLSHRLYYKLAVMREKEERTTAPCTLSSFEHHVTVELRAK